MVSSVLICKVTLATFLFAISLGNGKMPQQKDENPEEVTVCRLKNDPGAYNHKLVKITGFVSHGFEDFSIYDPECSGWPAIWLEYGGTKGSDTMYCCGIAPKETRQTDVSVENIKVPLLNDDRFQQFNKIIEGERDTTIHATIIGRFFSGRETKNPNGLPIWEGYGHMGCCSMLLIQQVISVDSHDRSDLDYHASADQPNIDKVGCGYRELIRDWRFTKALDLQRRAESGERGWAFDDPARVAKDLLAHEAGVAEASIVNLKVVRTAPGRVVFTWQPPKTKSSYMVVASRPYTLSFYSTNPQKVSWVPIAAYRVGCDADNSVQRVK
jgi:hypothetical protein